MASIPLPALHVNPPADPGEGFQRLLAMKGMLQQQQLQNVNLQQQQMELKQRQALQSLYMKHNGDLDKVIADAPQAGIMPDKIQALQLHKLDIQQKYSTMAKDDAETGSKNVDTQLKKNDQIRGAINAAMGVPDEQLVAHVTQTAADLTKQGFLDPQHAQAVQQLTSLPPQELREQLKLLNTGLMSETQQLTKAKEGAQTAEANARAGEATANQKKAEAALPGVVAEGQIKQAEADMLKQGGMTQPMADAKYRYLQQKLAAKTPISPENQNFLKAYEKQKLLVPVASANIRMEGMGKIRQFPVYDNQTKQTVYMDSNEINDAKLREPGRYTVPQFSGEAITQVQTAKTMAPGGKGGEEALAFQTAIQHADLLKKAAQALNNGDTRTLNSLKNTLATEFGDADLTNFNAIKHVYENEVQKMIAGSHITDAELKKNDASLPDNANFETTMKVLNSYQALAQSKLSLRQKQEQLGKEGKSMTSAGSQPEGMIRARDQQGKLHEAPAGTALPPGWTLEK